jgi:hypothetical protein
VVGGRHRQASCVHAEQPVTANMSTAVDVARQLPAQIMPAVQAAAGEDSGCLGTTAPSGGVTECAADPALVDCSSLTYIPHAPAGGTAELAACSANSSSGSSKITTGTKAAATLQ